MRAASAALAFAISSVFAAGVAAAEPNLTAGGYEAGYVWTHFDNTTIPGGWNLDGQLVRASAYATTHRHTYVAVEIDVGWLSGSGVANAGVPVQTTARTTAAAATTTMPTDTSGATVGRLIQAKAVAGWRTLRGPIGLAMEVAGGVREVNIGDTRFSSSTSSQTDGIIEARGRAYVWLGRGVTLGAIAGVNIVQRDNVTVGVMLGLHLPR